MIIIILFVSRAIIDTTHHST